VGSLVPHPQTFSLLDHNLQKKAYDTICPMSQFSKGPKSYLVTVVPISRARQSNALSYFSLAKIKVGEIVRVPARKKKLLAVTMNTRDVKNAKSDIRRSGFALRKISERDQTGGWLSENLISAVKKTALHFATSPAEIFSALLPRIIIDEPEIIGRVEKIKNRNESRTIVEPIAIQMETDSRMSHYRSTIRQSFARGLSVLYIAPSSLEAGDAYHSLSVGIREYSYLFTSKIAKKEQKRVWTEARDSKHPVLFVTTQTGVLFERKDLGTIILEGENSHSYKTLTRPFINYRTFLEYYAKISEKELILGDSILSIETLWRVKEGIYGELSPIKWRIEAKTAEIVDARSESNKNDRFRVISANLEKLIGHALKDRRRIILISARKGLSPITVCGDCDWLLSCNNCGAPMVLYGGKVNTYICHHCGMRRKSETVCDNCQSWKLVPLGIGTDLVAREVSRIFPLAEVRVFDKNHVSTESQARRLATDFSEEGGIVVGTELALYYIKSADYGGIVSIDSLFSLPEFSAEERIFRLIASLREIVTREVIIQTRRPDKEVLSFVANGNIGDFYRSEIEERKNLLYPPFATFIRIEGDNISTIKNKFIKWSPAELGNSLIIRLPRAKWFSPTEVTDPDLELHRELTLLSPEFSVKVEPESIL
jgi:primosomal protein N'